MLLGYVSTQYNDFGEAVITSNVQDAMRVSIPISTNLNQPVEATILVRAQRLTRKINFKFEISHSRTQQSISFLGRNLGICIPFFRPT